jgi:hypothetical protein
MPRVTNYEGQQVQERPLPGVRLTAAPSIDAAAAPGDKLMRIGADIYADETRKQDEIAVMEADNKLSDWEVKRLYDPQNGALNKRGKDAFGLPDQVGKELDDTIGEIRTSLSNDRQRMAFERRATARKTDINTTLSKHVFGEIRKHDDAETENFIANSRQSAVLNYDNPDRIGLEIERQQGAIVDYANRNGLGPEYVKQKVAQVHSDTHVGVIDRMLANGQDRGAKVYFDGVRTDIAGNDITKVEQKLQVAITEGEGMRAADDVWKTQGPRSDIDPVNIDTMADALRTKYANDPKTLKAALDNLKERAALHNAAQRERAEANGAAVWREVSNGSPLSSVTRMPEFLALPGHVQAQVKEHVVDRAYTLGERARAQGNRAEEDATKKNFAAYLVYSNPATLANMSEDQVVNLLPSLGRTLTGSLMEKKRSLVKSEDAVRQATIDEDLFKQTAQSAGLRPYHSNLSENEKADLGRLKNAVETAIDGEQRITGKPATRERKQQIMQEMVDRKVKLDVWGTDPEKPAALVKTDEREKAYVPIDKVPKQTQAEALNYMRSAGNIPAGLSDAQALERFRPRIERAYAARLIGATREQIANILQGKDGK